jgi:Flp pilus assembly protein TadD
LQLEVAERAVHAGRFDLAIERANAALKAGAEPGQVRETLGAAAFGAGELAAAIAELEQAVELQHEAVGTTSRLAAAYARAGRPDDARRLLTDLEQRVGGSPLHVATLARVHLALGDAERALALLARGVEQRQRDTLDIGIDPFFAAARDDPRFVALIERMGLPPPARGRDER